MKTTRRDFLKSAGVSAGVLGVLSPALVTRSAGGASSPLFLMSTPRMKLGIVTYNLAKDWDIPTIIKNCEAAKFDGVELRTSHAHKVEPDLSEEDRRRVKKRFDDTPVRLVCLGSTCEYHFPDPAEVRKNIELTKKFIVLAHDVGAEAVKVRPNGIPKEVEPARTLDQIGKALVECGQAGQDFGVKVRLEVHGGGTDRIENIVKILAAADHPMVEIVWNSNQTDLQGGLEANFAKVRSRIGQIHMRDLFIEEYPWRKLIALLRDSGFLGYACAEIGESNDPLRVMRYFRALFLAYLETPGPAAPAGR